MSDFDLIIRGGCVVRPDGVAKQDIGIKDGQITAVSAAVFGSTDADLDATDFHIFPGLVDANVRLSEPGRAHWEGFDRGSRALVAGGITSFFDLPHGSSPPVLDKDGFLAKWNLAKDKSLVDFGLWGGITPGNLDQMAELTDCGVIGFRAAMCDCGLEDFPPADDGTLLEAMRRAFDLEHIVCVHAENEGITARLMRQAVADKRLSARDYLDSRPAIAELEAIQRAIFLAWETDCALHIAQVSTARGIELIAGAKAQGLNVSCETNPHYLVLTEADAERLRAFAKCAPPLRSAREQAALWKQLASGSVDMIASAHAPAGMEVKRSNDLFSAQEGIAGCQSILPLLLTEAYGTDHAMPLPKLSELLATNAARRFRLHPVKGEITPGADADLVIFDVDEVQVLREEGLFYRHPEHTPYLGRELRGRILRTMLRGQTIFREGHIVVGKSSARLLRPAEVIEEEVAPVETTPPKVSAQTALA